LRVEVPGAAAIGMMASMTNDPNYNPFPGHRIYPTDVAVFDQIEQVALAIQQLHDAMTATSATHRWLATSMMSDEVGDVLRMIQVDQLEFAARNLRDYSGLITMTPVAGPPTA
jgi:hypothetical protein